MHWDALRQALPALNDRIYLNTGTSGPIPTASAEAQIALLMRLVDEGFSSPPVAQAYFAALATARQAIARLLACDVREVALTHSTSDGIGIVASGLEWNEGDEVILCDLEHVSGVAPWVELAKRRGVKVTTLASDGGAISADRLIEAMTDRTRLICMSHVSYSTGAQLPVEAVCRAARRAGVLTLIDGAQAAGWAPLSVKELQCDFYALPGQKWLLGPEGTGALYVDAAALEWVAPTRIGWPSLASDRVLPGGGCDFHADARRFETGTMHAPAFSGLAHSIGMLEAIGWERIRDRSLALARMAREQLTALPQVEIVSPDSAPSGLLTWRVTGYDPERLVKQLWAKHRVIIRTIPDLSALRASFHAFNNEADVAALVDATRALLTSEG